MLAIATITLLLAVDAGKTPAVGSFVGTINAAVSAPHTRDLEPAVSTPHESLLLPLPDFLELNGTTGKVATLAYDDAAGTWTEAAYNPAARTHYLLDEDGSVFGYNYRTTAKSLGADYTLDSRLCEDGDGCFVEWHWSSALNGIVAIAQAWPTPFTSSLVLIDPTRYHRAQFGTFYLNMTIAIKGVKLGSGGSIYTDSTALDDATATYYAVLPVGAGSNEKDQLWAYNLLDKTSRVVLSVAAPMPFIVLPHTGLLLGYNAGGGENLTVVNVADGTAAPFAASGGGALAGLASDQAWAWDASTNTSVVIVFDLNRNGRAALQRIDHVERTISPPMLLSKVLQFLTYYG